MMILHSFFLDDFIPDSIETEVREGNGLIEERKDGG